MNFICRIGASCAPAGNGAGNNDMESKLGMKKIGIITLMHGFNYGGMLQCYALQQALKELGNETEIIDYPMSPRRRQFRRFTGCLGQTGARWLENSIWHLRPERGLFRNFEGFRRCALKLSRRINSRSALTNLSRQFDAVVVGSDQVWNQSWYTPEYFLDFAASGVLKISYAACSGAVTDIPAARRNELIRLLQDFARISVRNQMTQNFVCDLTGNKPPIVADPTLLASWPELAKPTAIAHREYILLYALSRETFLKNRHHIHSLAAELKLPLVVIRSKVLQPWLEDFSDSQWHDPAVFDWVAAFQHARYVFTDSFHGTLFAAINRKPLWNYIGKHHSFERVAYIAERYQLLLAYCNPEQVMNNLHMQGEPEYYNQVHAAIAEHRTFSMDWLRQALQ